MSVCSDGPSRYSQGTQVPFSTENLGKPLEPRLNEVARTAARSFGLVLLVSRSDYWVNFGQAVYMSPRIIRAALLSLVVDLTTKLLCLPSFLYEIWTVDPALAPVTSEHENCILEEASEYSM